MSESEQTQPLGMDEQAILQMLEASQAVRKGSVIEIEAGGRKWKIRPTSQAQNQIMANLDLDVMFWQRQLKDEQTPKEAKRLNTLIRKAYAKKAAHKVLGMWLRWVPFLYALTWRRIYHSSEAVSATINSTESIGENKVFYLANLGSSKQALVLCMTGVGEAARQLTKRMESAESMVEMDGLPTKADSK